MLGGSGTSGAPLLWDGDGIRITGLGFRNSVVDLLWSNRASLFVNKYKTKRRHSIRGDPVFLLTLSTFVIPHSISVYRTFHLTTERGNNPEQCPVLGFSHCCTYVISSLEPTNIKFSWWNSNLGFHSFLGIYIMRFKS